MISLMQIALETRCATCQAFPNWACYAPNNKMHKSRVLGASANPDVIKATAYAILNQIPAVCEKGA